MSTKGYKRILDPDTGKLRYVPPDHPLIRDGRALPVPRDKDPRMKALPHDAVERTYAMAMKHYTWPDVAASFGMSHTALRKLRDEGPDDAVGVAFARGRARAMQRSRAVTAAKAENPEDPKQLDAHKFLERRAYPELEVQQPTTHVSVELSVLPQAEDDLSVLVEGAEVFPRGKDPKPKPDPFAALKVKRGS